MAPCIPAIMRQDTPLALGEKGPRLPYPEHDRRHSLVIINGGAGSQLPETCTFQGSPIRAAVEANPKRDVRQEGRLVLKNDGGVRINVPLLLYRSERRNIGLHLFSTVWEVSLEAYAMVGAFLAVFTCTAPIFPRPCHFCERPIET